MRYEAVIFDLFGTLVDNILYEEYMNVLRQVAPILGVPFDEFMRLWSETGSERSLGTYTTIEANMEYICYKLGVNLSDSLYRYLLNDSKVTHMVIDGVGKFINFRKYLGEAVERGVKEACVRFEQLLETEK